MPGVEGTVPTLPPSDATLASRHSPRKPLSPLHQPTDVSSPGPSRSYDIPGSSSPTAHQSHASGAHQRISMSGPPRRLSPLLHEIQPPRRRLSDHQVLLLTPFGDPIPPAALVFPVAPDASVMSRGLSSMGGSLRGGFSGPASGTMHVESGTSIMRENTSTTFARLPGRASRLSLTPAAPVPSPLSAFPMTTIHSNSDRSSDGRPSHPPSREPSQQNDQTPVEVNLPSTVPMTRSNSLPVMTLQELQALKQKDGELGIYRGGDWAWISRDLGEVSGDISTDHVPIMSESTTTSNSSSSLITATPPATQSLFTFNDPFNPRNSVVAPSAALSESIPFPDQYHPVATSEGYHYSPHNDRRASETLPPISSGPSKTHPSPRAQAVQPLEPARRQYAPAPQTHGRHASVPTLNAPQPDLPPALAKLESPGGTPRSGPSPHMMRRYKTSPARYTGPGLEIFVSQAISTGGSPSAGVFSESSGRRRSDESDSGNKTGPTAGPLRGKSRPRVRDGSWAQVGIIDDLEAGAATSSSRTPDTGSISSLASSRGSVSAGSLGRQSRASVASARGSNHANVNVVLFDQSPATESPATDFSGFGAMVPVCIRNRIDSVDSALPATTQRLMGGGDGMGRFDTFPRRGSLAVMRDALGSCVTRGAWVDGGLPPGSWAERRGSWAEGWGKK